MTDETIVVRGAREHNLQGVDLTLPRNQLIVFTGVSGSGKSSLAFDTLYAEGQRRYIESLSTYARQFLGQLRKPDVDFLGGLSPSISIEQKTAGTNPRSTVGTITEIYDYLRVLFARVGRGHCPNCDRPIEAQSREQILGRILTFPAGTQISLMAPTVRGQKGEFKDYFAEMIRRGFVNARVDGRMVRLTDRLDLDRQMRHTIAIVVDRLKVEPNARPRIAEAVEQALALSEGAVLVVPEGEDQQEVLLSSHYACSHCDLSFEPPSPQLFSFNSPHGMCMSCDGLGVQNTFDPELMAPDPTLSLRNGAITLVGPLTEMSKKQRSLIESIATAFGVPPDAPWKHVPVAARNRFLQGDLDRIIRFTVGDAQQKGKWRGVIPVELEKYKNFKNPMMRAKYEKQMRVLTCPICRGDRLNSQARHVRIASRTLPDLSSAAVSDLAEFLERDLGPTLTPVEQLIAGELVKEIRARVGFLLDVGLEYLSLNRTAPTLSGGELQRIRLAGQIGSGLVGVLYVLDEPSIGLHPRDNARLIATLERLRDQGNTVLVVEHDEETIRAADVIVDFGPGPGVRGGRIVAEGSLSEVMNAPESLTGKYLSGEAKIEIPVRRLIANFDPRSSPAPVAAPTFVSKAAKKAAAKKTTKKKEMR